MISGSEHENFLYTIKISFFLLTTIYRTLLYFAIALNKNYNISQVLMETSGNLHNQNANSKTFLHIFPNQVSKQLLRCHGHLLQFSTCNYCDISLLHYLAWSSKALHKTFRRHYECGTLNLRSVDIEGRSILHLATQKGNIPIVEYLASLTKNFNINQGNNRGKTVLYYRVENKRAYDIITALILNGADI